MPDLHSGGRRFNPYLAYHSYSLKGHQMELCIGLFGTCGKSKWRDPFITMYDKNNINFFNPQVDDWEPSMAEKEAHHLAHDAVILFPVLGETYGLGSLAETGFSILNALKLDDHRHFVIMIEKDLDEKLKSNPELYKESARARALIKEHLSKIHFSNVYVVDSLEKMLNISVVLYGAAKSQKFARDNISL